MLSAKMNKNNLSVISKTLFIMIMPESDQSAKLKFDYLREIGYDIIDKLWKGGGWDAALSHLYERPQSGGENPSVRQRTQLRCGTAGLCQPASGAAQTFPPAR